ncbi:MAG TPA: hypothetical protein VN461_20955 [Vicinamibacteria bacterium]|jgi:hypothetical protein|nr:hypothetical protein [Vicinamibacteria bacterium]
MRAWPLAFLIAASGCGGGGVTTPSPPLATPTPAAAGFSISVNPNPVVAADSADADAPLIASWTVKVSSTSTVGARVNFVNATLRDGTSGAEAEPSGVVTLAAADITAQDGTNRVEPKSSLSVSQSLQYRLPSGGRTGTLTVTAQFRDDNGNLSSQSDQAAVN